MKATLAKTLFACFAILTSTGTINAGEMTNADGNAIVNSRPLSAELQKRLAEERRAEFEEIEEILSEESTDLSGLIIPIHHPNSEGDYEGKTQLAGLQIPIKNLTTLTTNQLNATTAKYSPFAFHWIESFPSENILKLEDGSEWRVHDNQTSIIFSWRTNAPIVITPVFSWFTTPSYPYLLHNKETDQSVKVKMQDIGPFRFGPLSTWVAGIDKSSAELFLINGQGDRTQWEVHPSDRYLLEGTKNNVEDGWNVNDAVVIGKNDGWLWWFSSYDHILINVESDHYIRIRPVSSTPNSYSILGR